MRNMTYERFEYVAGAWILAGVVLVAACLLGVCACRVVARVREGLQQQARTVANYPEPVCEWCGRPMDGRSCTCEGREL
ncbi:MAG: hypothetical protein PHO37_17060 [Kiritimatiellae bacterium]|nr:hypothetical protein [Kiritimatiellia bacterium]